MSSAIIRAAMFAVTQHSGQKRRGKVAQPFIIHTLRVANRLDAATKDRKSLIIAAILHDVLEDTNATYEQLLGEFGETVADLVVEVTDDPTVSKADRWAWQIGRMGKLSFQAQLLKIADQTDNVIDMGVDPPVSWDFERRKGYLKKAAAIVAAATITPNEELEILLREFDHAFVSSMTLINAQEEIVNAGKKRKEKK